MEWRPAGWSVCLPLLIFPCTVKSRSSLLAPAHLGGPGKKGRKTVVVWCGVVYVHHRQCIACEGRSIAAWWLWLTVCLHRSAGGMSLSELIWLIHLLQGWWGARLQDLPGSQPSAVDGSGWPGWLVHPPVVWLCVQTWHYDSRMRHELDVSPVIDVTSSFHINWCQWIWIIYLWHLIRYGDGAGYTVEENSSVFSLIWMR